MSCTDLSPNRYLDDFQLYDGVLSQEQIAFLYNNPGAVAPISPESFDDYIFNPAFGLGVDEKGVNDDLRRRRLCERAGGLAWDGPG